MKPKLTSNLILRIDEDMKAELGKIQKDAGCQVSELVRQCLSSIIDYYDKNKCIVLPLVVLPKKDYETLLKGKTKAK